MDVYHVPKKVNRHVLKAVNFLSSDNDNGAALTLSQILNRVEYQMKDLVPVDNIKMMVQKSLKNLSDVGLLNRVGPQAYTVGSSGNLYGKSEPNRDLFKPSVSGHQNAFGRNLSLISV